MYCRLLVRYHYYHLPYCTVLYCAGCTPLYCVLYSNVPHCTPVLHCTPHAASLLLYTNYSSTASLSREAYPKQRRFRARRSRSQAFCTKPLYLLQCSTHKHRHKHRHKHKHKHICTSTSELFGSGFGSGVGARRSCFCLSKFTGLGSDSGSGSGSAADTAASSFFFHHLHLHTHPSPPPSHQPCSEDSSLLPSGQQRCDMILLSTHGVAALSYLDY